MLLGKQKNIFQMGMDMDGLISFENLVWVAAA